MSDIVERLDDAFEWTELLAVAKDARTEITALRAQLAEQRAEVEADREAIRADERAKIVKWLKFDAYGEVVFLNQLADAIARGDHRKDAK